MSTVNRIMTAEGKEGQGVGPVSWDGRLNAMITELSGGAVDAQIRALAAFETHAAGSIANQTTAGQSAGVDLACLPRTRCRPGGGVRRRA